jgi:MFS family permease
MAVISSTIGQTQFYVDMKLAPQGSPGYAHTANLIGAMNGANSAGSALGAVLTTWSADKFGRLKSIQFGAVVLIVGAILCAGSVDVGMFLAARVIAGFGIGMLITVSAEVYDLDWGLG